MSFELPLPPFGTVTLDGVSVRVGPAGELVAVSVAVQVKLLMLFRVIVLFGFDPGEAVRLDGFAAMEKSATWALRNSVMGVAEPSPVLIVVKLQFVSMVRANEYWSYWFDEK